MSHYDSHPSSLPRSTQSPPRLIVSPIQLVANLPQQFTPPKFQVGQSVLWARVPTHGFGRIIGLVFAQSVSVEAIGYHYAIALDDQCPSRADCAADWAFEDDLELLSTHAYLLQG
ncbi:hypothetical protein [Leptolyngbya ohadii]|uniref:hypothetical protein n=1 Tax=Leptolyngbya ohadii TaxID=1962290 RepID=UPI000B59C0C4|nr:hypothetical protein [Leptolyngbya ohadii]